MFGIGPMELLVVAIVAIVFVGPQRLPEMMKKFGKLFVQVRRQTEDVRNSFSDVMRDAERELELDRIKELKSQVEKVRNKNLLDYANDVEDKDKDGEDKGPVSRKPKNDDEDYHESHFVDGEFVNKDDTFYVQEHVDIFEEARKAREKAAQDAAARGEAPPADGQLAAETQPASEPKGDAAAEQKPEDQTKKS